MADEKKLKTAADVALYWPNVVDYARLLMVIAPAVLDAPPLASAALYVASHALDLVDGKLARALGQCSRFGVVLDYSVDIVTEMVWFMRIAPLDPRWLPVFALMAVVDVFGLVLCVHNSAAGRYWKGPNPYRPRLQYPIINDQGYTYLGYSVVVLYQAFWACVFLAAHPTAAVSWAASAATVLALPAAIEAASLAMILYEQLGMFRE